MHHFKIKVTNIMTMIVRRSSDFESNITSVERLTEYLSTPHEVSFYAPNQIIFM